LEQRLKGDADEANSKLMSLEENKKEAENNIENKRKDLLDKQ
jgi:hypothetical protein